MMKVTAVNNGVVIDHITAGKCMKLYQFLDLDHVDATIALIKNAPSQKMGKNRHRAPYHPQSGQKGYH